MNKAIPSFLITIAVSAGILAGSPVFAEQTSTPTVIAYYFHGSYRCSTCKKLELYSREAVESNFKDELASGRLEFKAINVEDKGNEHFTKDYQLYTKSLVIALRENGKEVKFKNLAKIWDYTGDKQKFFDYVTSQINSFLKGS